LRERAETFRRVTGTRKSLFLTFVTARGLAPGDYVTELVVNEVSAAALFEPYEAWPGTMRPCKW